MPSMICISCSTSDDSVEFPTIADLVAHTKGGHVSRPEKVLPPSRPVTPSATELKDMKEATKSPISPVKDEKGMDVLPVIKPLELQYKWTGIHAPCNSEPKTLEISMGDHTFMMVAYCIPCDVKITEMRVAGLNSQEKRTAPQKK